MCGLADHAVDHKPVCCFGTSHQHLQLTVRLFRLKLMQRHTVSVAKPGQDVVDVIALAPPQVSSKIGVIETLINKVDKIILGGGMIFTFYKARGLAVGSSLVRRTSWSWPRASRQLPRRRCAEHDNHLHSECVDHFSATHVKSHTPPMT